MIANGSIARAAQVTAPAILALALSACLLAPSRAAAQIDAQVSSRLVLGGGAEFPARQDSAALFELGVRSEVLFGDPAADRFRLGPALDLRSAALRTFEAAGGVAILVPLGFDFAIEASLAVGFAARPEGRDGGVGVLTVRAAYQPYDHFDCYSHGVAIYGSGRAGLDLGTFEVTAGLEVDLEFVFATPFVYAVTALSGRDPDEPSAPDEPSDPG